MAGQVWKQTFLNQDSYMLVNEDIDSWSVYYIEPHSGRPDKSQYCKIETKVLITLYEKLP